MPITRSIAISWLKGRFGCAVMDEDHLAAALVHVMLNPVRARLVERTQDWRWSSARAYLRSVADGLTQTQPVLERFPDMGEMLKNEADADALRRLRAAETVGRPLGEPGYLRRIEHKTGRDLKPSKRGPKPKRRNVD